MDTRRGCPCCLEQILHVCGDRSAYFWVTHGGAELDLLLLHGGRRLGFEFKFSDQPGTTKSMLPAMQDLALEQLYVVYAGEHEFPLAEAITAIPLWRLIERLELSPAAARYNPIC
jgi:predicted AAA+ superfamily ATPase